MSVGNSGKTNSAARDIWAVVLAAGESRRMGKPKLLLPVGKRTMLETVVEAALASAVDGVLVVLGAFRDVIEGKVAGLRVKTAVNPEYKTGMLSSIRTGLRALPASASAAVILLGDQPFIPPRVVDRLIEAYRRTHQGIVVPSHGGRRGHPLLLDMKYRQEILALDSETGLKELLIRHPGDVLEVPVSTPSVLQDIDTPGDYTLAVKSKG